MISSGEIDAIHICTPHPSHREIGVEALKAGLHVLMEKPLAVHKGDCQALIDAYDATGREKVFAAMFNQRTDPHYKILKEKIDSGEIEIAPLAFMRGRTLKNCFAILDEAQNATETQIKMFLTRIGENSKLVVNGDPSQIDLINKSQSGLIKSKDILKDLNEIKIIEFDHTDVVRHPLVSKIIRAYQRKSTDDKS